jgi:hypothetical protein
LAQQAAQLAFRDTVAVSGAAREIPIFRFVTLLGPPPSLSRGRSPSVRGDDCSGVKEAAIERAKTPHSDTHVTNVAGKAVEAGRATDERR